MGSVLNSVVLLSLTEKEKSEQSLEGVRCADLGRRIFPGQRITIAKVFRLQCACVLGAQQ